MSFGEDLKKARTEADFSQNALARELGVSRETIGAWERGSNRPETDNLARLQDVLGVTFDVQPVARAPRQVPSLDPNDPPPRKQDAPPKAPKGKSGKTAQTVGIMSLADQLQFPYLLAADAMQSRLPSTASILRAQAPQCAAAWDQLLLRYPSLREKIEQGMIAGDVLALLMAHLPIIQMAREEAAAIRAFQNGDVGYDGGMGGTAPQAA